MYVDLDLRNILHADLLRLAALAPEVNHIMFGSNG